MDTDDPRHGQRRGYIAGCRDACCRIPHLRYQKRSTLRRYREGSQVIDAACVLARINHWADRGVSANAITTAAGLGGGTLAELVEGHRNVIYKANARKVLAVTWEDLPDNALCNANLTIARIRSMMAAGHPLAWITHNVEGIAVGGKWRYQSAVRLRVARSVANLYRRAPLDGPSRITATKARRGGSVHPLAWDDPGTPAAPRDWELTPLYGDGRADFDPVVVMRLLEGDTVPSTKAEKDAAMAQWVEQGGSQAELCRAHGWKQGRYGRLTLVEGGAA